MASSSNQTSDLFSCCEVWYLCQSWECNSVDTVFGQHHDVSGPFSSDACQRLLVQKRICPTHLVLGCSFRLPPSPSLNELGPQVPGCCFRTLAYLTQQLQSGLHYQPLSPAIFRDLCKNQPSSALTWNPPLHFSTQSFITPIREADRLTEQAAAHTLISSAATWGELLQSSLLTLCPPRLRCACAYMPAPVNITPPIHFSTDQCVRCCLLVYFVNSHSHRARPSSLLHKQGV